ncbi:ferritin-like domain-containing protein [Desulfoferrobacter suflitae]|uniref:ferritin-like domain-containing protein n=1 Tax=Desulfoferrobacter suflitae TaxID=2865782 RepID=UPI002164C37A|nr:ferritin family protein [Desulfoferrobacter suflitae]MCK8602557.1 ferritin family protein [Desulfoferrobacter suflitae]
MSTVSCSSMNDVVQFAIEKEEKAMDFYQKCADRAKNPGIKKFFEEMAEEEQRHKKLLQDLDPSGLDSLKLEKVEDLRISDYLVEVQFKEDITYQEALTLAMKKEEKAYEFYNAWKNKCMQEKTAKLFEMLAQEEMKHKRKIETVYDEEILTWD